MLTLRSAAHLLRSANDPDGLHAIAAAAGCTGPAATLDSRSKDSLGIGDMVHEARVIGGPGSLRALTAVATAGTPLRERAAALARSLARTSPHLLWLALVADHEGRELAICAWDPAAKPLRIAALHVARTRVSDSDAETLAAIASAHETLDLARHSRWLELLGRQALSRRFYRTLEDIVGALADEMGDAAPLTARREMALLLSSRLLFLSFLQAKGWLDRDRDFLGRRFAECMLRGGHYHARILRPLFFGTLNTPPARRAPAARGFGRIPFLNGGLFARTAVERRYPGAAAGDAAIGRFHHELLGRYRFTAREDSSGWSDAAIDPEMLGHAFESLMAPAERKASGAFYTPQAVVEQLVDDALRARLGHEAGLAQLRALRVLDPACGSGAFLVRALERIAQMRAGLGEGLSLCDIRRDVLVRSIFGVDVNPVAAWLCELRLWLSVVIDSDVSDPLRVLPLPNLDRNVRVGDALSGAAFDVVGVGEARPVRRLRERYARASGARKRAVARSLEREERRLALQLLDRERDRLQACRRDCLAVARARDLWGQRRSPTPQEHARLAALRSALRACARARDALARGGALPFSFSTHFAEAAAAGGFDIVIGNPPWVRIHRIPARERAALRDRYAAYRDAAWRPGAVAASAGTGFAGQVDLAALFVERSIDLLSPAGTLALLLPAKLLRTLAGGGARREIMERTSVRSLEDFSEGSPLFDAATYPAALVASRTAAVTPPLVAVHRRSEVVRWRPRAAGLTFDDSPGSPFVLLPPEARDAFERMRSHGTPLADSAIGRPTLGVKSGCNEAFLVRPSSAKHLARWLRPALRGESLRAWTVGADGDSILWTHAGDGRAHRELPAPVRTHLLPFRARLAARSDLRNAGRWWSLFRTDAASCTTHRVVWADIARTPRALVLPRGDPTVPLNSCYVAACADELDALAFCALLNSPLVAAWLGALAEPARGGYRRYLGWTVALLPLPCEWPSAREILAGFARTAIAGSAPAAEELDRVVRRMYRLTAAQASALISWNIP